MYHLAIKISILACFAVGTTFGQYNKQIFDTDVSTIVVERTKSLRIYTETFKQSDSIYYNVVYRENPTQLYTEGWLKDQNKRIGIWKEYTLDGILKFTWDYDSNICTVNEELYPRHQDLAKMKEKSDSLVKEIYGESFYSKHVQFKFNIDAYDSDGYLGSWTEPLAADFTTVQLTYDVVHDGITYPRMIGVGLRKDGSFIKKNIPGENYGFEKLEEPQQGFSINQELAFAELIKLGVLEEDLKRAKTSLVWEDARNKKLYHGSFKYYALVPQANAHEESRHYSYDVFLFNPWTGDFIEQKRMRSPVEFTARTTIKSNFLRSE